MSADVSAHMAEAIARETRALIQPWSVCGPPPIVTSSDQSELSAGGRGIDEMIVGAPARRRDAQTLVEIESEHGQRLFGFARRLGLSDEQADDAVQETLLRLWRELDRGVYVADPPAWAFRAIYRLAMDEHRARRRFSALRDRLAGIARKQPAPDLADRIAVWAEVDRLPVRQRHVLYLRYRADRSFEQIAGILGISASAARSHCTQATATLRRRLASEES